MTTTVLKYKIHEFAKDLDFKSNKVIELLGRFSEGARKSQTALTAEELDFAFDVLSRDYAVDDFGAYFARVKPAEPEPGQPEQTVPQSPDYGQGQGGFPFGGGDIEDWFRYFFGG